MDYLRESLVNIASISLHWSSDCNMACKYCYIDKDKQCMANFNKGIRESLEDGTFVENIKKVFCTDELRNNIEDLSLWGAEPTINGKYFEQTIVALLDYFPNVKSFMFSTNALVGAEFIYKYFFLPLLNYCNTHNRALKWNLQLSLDGPPEFNDDSRHAGATKNTLATIFKLLDDAPLESPYLSISLMTKPTLDISYMRIMNEQGLDCFNWYYQFFDKLQTDALMHRGEKTYFDIHLNQMPTLVDPGFHTQDDGKTLAKWISQLKFVDRSKLPTYAGLPLFSQIMSGLEIVQQASVIDNPIAHEYNAYSCSASKNNITIDHNGILYTCNRLCRNIAMPEEFQTKHAMRAGTNLHTSDRRWLMKTWGSMIFHCDLMSRRYLIDMLLLTMAKAGQIDYEYYTDENLRLILFYMSVGLTCHIGNEEDLTGNPSLMPTGIIRLLGNGAVQAMLEYWAIEQKRGEISKWKIV